MKFTCNICSGTEFEDFNKRPLVRCTNCGSLERTRLLALYLHHIPLKQGAKVLHIAPEQGIFEYFSSRSEIDQYTVADFNPSLYKFTECEKIDLCNLEDWPSNHYDLILHCHVLEHTPCNIAYSLYHIHRMLADSGRHVFIVPFSTGKFEESFRPLPNAERIQRFGQWDHLRRFGREDIDSHLGKVVRMPSDFDATSFASEAVLERANIPMSSWYGMNASAVIDLAKDDYRLGLLSGA